MAVDRKKRVPEKYQEILQKLAEEHLDDECDILEAIYKQDFGELDGTVNANKQITFIANAKRSQLSLIKQLCQMMASEVHPTGDNLDEERRLKNSIHAAVKKDLKERGIKDLSVFSHKDAIKEKAAKEDVEQGKDAK